MKKIVQTVQTAQTQESSQFRKDDPWTVNMPHAWAFWAGENNDPESGLPHMAHAAWNALALVEYLLRTIGKDDRPNV